MDPRDFCAPAGTSIAMDAIELEREESGHDELAGPVPEASGPGMPGIMQLAWPAILGNLGYALVGLVDIKIVGSLGASAVAAVTTGHRIFWVSEAVLIAITAGTTALVARAWGASNTAEAQRATQASLWVCCGLGLALTVPIYVYAHTLVSIFNLEPETLALAAEFLRVLALFNVFFAASMVLGSALRAAGDVMTPLWVGLVTNVCNIALVYGLVYGRFGLPAMGVMGAALANGIAFTLGTFLICGLWLRGYLRIRLQRGRSLTAERIRQLFHIGYPAGIEQGTMEVGFVLFLWVVALYGTPAYAAYGIGVQILSVSFLVGFGFTIAASTHVGQLLGAGDPEGATRSGWRATRLSVTTMTILGGAIALAAEPLAGFMIDDPEVIRMTVIFIYIMAAVQPLMGIVFTLGGALRGAGDTRFPLLTTLVGLVGFRAGSAGLFAWLGLDITWIFGSLILDYMVKSAMLIWRFRSGRWQKIKL
jgi:putative MATE family efflux protein